LLATLFAPRLAEHYGWQATFGIAILPLALLELGARWAQRWDSAAVQRPVCTRIAACWSRPMTKVLREVKGICAKNV
jgi:hypothetical protein